MPSVEDEEEKVIDGLDKEKEELGEGAKTPEKVKTQEGPQTNNSVPKMSKMSSKIEPPTFVSQTKSYATYKKDLKMWSRITSIEKKLQAEVVVYSLDGHPSGIKEKIQVGIGSKLEDNEEGIEELMKFLDGIYLQDEMSEAWMKYKSFQKVERGKNQEVLAFISDFDREYNLAKAAGCVYSDTILAFRLLEAAKLSENDEKFILTAVDFEEGKKGNLTDQMKASLKKFQGRALVSSDSKNEIKFDSALVNKMKDVLVAQGWQRPEKSRKRSNSNPEGLKKNSPNYKGRKNPLGEDGKALRCFNCHSEYHLSPKCDKKKKVQIDDKEDGAMLVTEIENMLMQEGKANETLLTICSDKLSPISSSTSIDQNPVQENPVISSRSLSSASTSSFDENSEELVMVTEKEEQLCLLVEEAKERGVIDSACSRTVAGISWVKNFINKLEEADRKGVKIEKGGAMFQFGGGEKRRSAMKISLPCMIGDLKVTLITEVVDAKIPLLVGTNSLEKSKAILDFGRSVAALFGQEVKMFKVGSGHFCIELLREGMSTHINGEENREKMISQVFLNQECELSFKQLQKLHHVFGHTKVDRLEKLIKAAGKGTEQTKKSLEKIKSTCEACIKMAKTKPKPKVALPRANKFGDVVTVDLKEYDRQDKARRYICYLVDMFSRLTVAKFIPSKEPDQIVGAIMEKWIGVGYGAIGTLHSDLGGENCNEIIEDAAANMDIKLTTTASYSPHQNGLNERNHATVDYMMKKMLESDSRMSPETALFWSLNAKNSLDNCFGFSPYQLVFSANPKSWTLGFRECYKESSLCGQHKCFTSSKAGVY